VINLWAGQQTCVEAGASPLFYASQHAWSGTMKGFMPLHRKDGKR